MRCPACDHLNVPGVDFCSNCQTPLAALDAPTAQGPVETSLLTSPVSVLEPRPPVTVAATATLGDAIREMIGRRVGAILVTDAAGEIVGILTERDFLTRIVGQPAYEELPVSRFMTPSPETVTSADLLVTALAKMDAGGYRHLPVVAGGKPTGMISVRDVLRHLTALFPESGISTQ